MLQPSKQVRITARLTTALDRWFQGLPSGRLELAPIQLQSTAALLKYPQSNTSLVQSPRFLPMPAPPTPACGVSLAASAKDSLSESQRERG